MLRQACKRLQARLRALRETVTRQINLIDDDTSLFIMMILNAERKRALERPKSSANDDEVFEFDEVDG